MLPETYKADILEIIAIAKECPESLQGKCLEMLLEDYLKKAASSARKQTPTPKESEAKPPMPADKPEEDHAEEPEQKGGVQRDLLPTDLHLKARKFLDKFEVPIEDLNQLFFMEGTEIKPLYDDLKTTKGSETQVRIALLHALLTGLRTGDFQFDGEEVRAECQTRKAYDKKNFSANFKNSSGLFEAFDKYEAAASTVKLSEAGKKRLAEVIEELK